MATTIKKDKEVEVSNILKFHIDGNWNPIDFINFFEAIYGIERVVLMEIQNVKYLKLLYNSLLLYRDSVDFSGNIESLRKRTLERAKLMRDGARFDFDNEYRLGYGNKGNKGALRVNKINYASPGIMEIIVGGGIFTVLASLLKHYIPNKTVELENKEKEIDIFKKKIEIYKSLGLTIEEILKIDNTGELNMELNKHIKTLEDLSKQGKLTKFLE